MKKAIVTGILGQDPSLLAEYLLSLNYEVTGLYKRVSSGNDFGNLNDAYGNPNLKLIEGDITDPSFIGSLVRDVRPDEYFGLAAQSHVGLSFTIPAETFRVNADAVIHQLEAIKNFSPNTKFYGAATSEMLGGIGCPSEGFDEQSKFNPRSPYAIAKVAAFYTTKHYREAHGLFACSGILFNHSSIRRPVDFATRKITSGVADIVTGRAKKIRMGNLETFRDEGHAKDYVRAMHLMLQQPAPDDYVVATGEGATIRQMLEYVCSLAGLKLDDVYEQDERFMRPSDVPFLKGNGSKIRKLGWEPKYTWQSLLKEMYEHDLGLAQL